MLTSQMQGQAASYHCVPGTTYYVEVPKFQYVDKIIEVPQFQVLQTSTLNDSGVAKVSQKDYKGHWEKMQSPAGQALEGVAHSSEKEGRADDDHCVEKLCCQKSTWEELPGVTKDNFVRPMPESVAPGIDKGEYKVLVKSIEVQTDLVEVVEEPASQAASAEQSCATGNGNNVGRECSAVASPFGLKVGDNVGWILCDDDIRAGCHGIIDMLSEDWASVKFPTSSYDVNPKALYRCGDEALGFIFGEQVRWRGSNKDVRLGDVGIVIGPRAEDDNRDLVHVRFLGCVGCFDPRELRKYAPEEAEVLDVEVGKREDNQTEKVAIVKGGMGNGRKEVV
jgi:hypothetical protein